MFGDQYPTGPESEGEGYDEVWLRVAGPRLFGQAHGINAYLHNQVKYLSRWVRALTDDELKQTPLTTLIGRAVSRRRVEAPKVNTEDMLLTRKLVGYGNGRIPPDAERYRVVMPFTGPAKLLRLSPDDRFVFGYLSGRKIVLDVFETTECREQVRRYLEMRRVLLREILAAQKEEIDAFNRWLPRKAEKLIIEHAHVRKVLVGSLYLPPECGVLVGSRRGQKPLKGPRPRGIAPPLF